MSYTHESVTEWLFTAVCVCVNEWTSPAEQDMLRGGLTKVFGPPVVWSSIIEHYQKTLLIYCLFLLWDWKYSYHRASIKNKTAEHIDEPPNLQLDKKYTSRDVCKCNRHRGLGVVLQFRGLILFSYFLVINYLCTVFCIYFSCSVVLGNNATLSERSVKPYVCMYKAYIYTYHS